MVTWLVTPPIGGEKQESKMLGTAPVQSKPRGFPARYPGQCGRCDLPILEGQRIEKRDLYHFGHVDCNVDRDESQAAAYEAFAKSVVTVALVETDVDLSGLPLGKTYFAVPNSTGKLTFLSVTRPSKGKWVGHAFVQQFLGGQGDAQKLGRQFPGQPYVGQWPDLLKAIVADPKAAALVFATELGICSRCKAELTDESSRAVGMGPICRKALA